MSPGVNKQANFIPSGEFLDQGEGLRDDEVVRSRKRADLMVTVAGCWLWAFGALAQEPVVAQSCFEELRAADVEFEEIVAPATQEIALPIELLGPLHGVYISGAKLAPKKMDCRLAVTLLKWALLLREHGVVTLESYSIYRPRSRVQSTRRQSGHSKALALDLAALVFEDGTRLNILEHWVDKTKGVAPCQTTTESEPLDFVEPATKPHSIKQIVCQAVEQKIFQVVMTPHANAAHANHVHLEVVPGVDWMYVR